VRSLAAYIVASPYRYIDSQFIDPPSTQATDCVVTPCVHCHLPSTIQVVACLFVRPANLARNLNPRQSSTYNSLGPERAVDGNTRANREQDNSHTQLDPQAWWEIDLGNLANIVSIKVVVRMMSVWRVVLSDKLCVEWRAVCEWRVFPLSSK
jgi:hypothetical protein